MKSETIPRDSGSGSAKESEAKGETNFTAAAAAVDSDILLHETTLESIHSKLIALDTDIAAGETATARKRKRIAILEKRQNGLRSSREECAVLVRAVEGTFKRCLGRLRRRLDEQSIGSFRGEEVEAGDSVVDKASADEDDGKADIDKTDTNSSLINENKGTDVNGGKLRGTQAIGNESIFSTNIVPFHQNRAWVELMWSPRDPDEFSPKRREESRSTALLPFLLPPIPSAEALERVFHINASEISAKRPEANKNTDFDYGANVAAFLAGTCLDPLANAGYHELPAHLRVEEGMQPEQCGIRPHLIVCPYQLGGECADPSCLFQHLDKTRRGSESQVGGAVSTVLTNLQNLKGLNPPSPPVIDFVDGANTKSWSSLSVGDRTNSCTQDRGKAAVETGKSGGKTETKEISGGEKSSSEMAPNMWDGDEELDFVSLLPRESEDERDSDKDYIPLSIMNTGAIGEDGKSNQCEQYFGDASFSVDLCDKDNQLHRVFNIIHTTGRGSIRLVDLLLLTGFEVEEEEEVVKDDASLPTAKLTFLPSTNSSLGEIIGAALDGVMVSIHGGRFDVAYAILSLGRTLSSSDKTSIYSISIWNEIEALINACAKCNSGKFAQGLFDSQVSFARMGEIIKLGTIGQGEAKDSQSKSSPLLSKYHPTELLSSLTSLLETRNAAKGPGDTDDQDVQFIRGIKTTLKRYLPSPPFDQEQREAGTPQYTSQPWTPMEDFFFIGRDLESFLLQSTMVKEALSVHTMIYLLLEPLLTTVTEYLSKLEDEKSGSIDVVKVRCFVTRDPVVLGCCLIGRVLFASVSIILSSGLNESSSTEGNIRSTYDFRLLLDSKLSGTVTALGNFLNKAVRRLRRMNDSPRRSIGSQYFGDILLAPLHSLCVSLSVAIGAYAQSRHLVDDGFGRASSPSSFVHSELLWSQFLYLQCISQLLDGNESHKVNGSDSNSNSPRVALDYGLNLRHFLLQGDSGLAKQAMANSIDGGADRGGGLEACNATLFSLCNSRLQRKEKRPSKKFSLCLAQPKEVLEIGQTPGKVCAHEFPTCIFLLNELTHLTFSGYSIRHIPLTIGSLLPYLKVR